ncbi:MAG: TetR/AcrR family transcriptional regulator [Solobacterium sp.]|nr:TetR/AcrR family transcriptional regulator [Solobacterium sp.]
MQEKTKLKLGQCLEELIQTRPLDRITISNISDACSVNRQTFYYHFRNIDDMLVWYLGKVIFQEDDVITIDTWPRHILDILNNINAHKNLVYQAFHSKSRDVIEAYVHRHIGQPISLITKDIAKDKKISTEDIEFISYFFTSAFCGVLTGWIDSNMINDKDKLYHHIVFLTNGSIKATVQKYSL